MVVRGWLILCMVSSVQCCIGQSVGQLSNVGWRLTDAEWGKQYSKVYWLSRYTTEATFRQHVACNIVEKAKCDSTGSTRGNMRYATALYATGFKILTMRVQRSTRFSLLPWIEPLPVNHGYAFVLLCCLIGISALQQWHSKNLESCIKYFMLKDRQVVYIMLLYCLNGIPALQQWHSTNVESRVNYSLLKDRHVVCNMLLCCLSGIPALQQLHSTNVESSVNYSLLKDRQVACNMLLCCLSGIPALESWICNAESAQ